MFNLSSMAYAMGQSGAAGQGGGGFGAFVPIILMFVIFYFLLIRPQQKKTKDHREMINNLKKGDRIITSGGLHARITAVDDTALTVEISDKVRVKLNRGSVSALIQPSTENRSEKQKPEKGTDK